MIELFYLLLIFILINLGFVLFGYAIIRTFHKSIERSFYLLFISFLVGLCSLIVVFSLVKTNGMSINLVLLAILLLLFRQPLYFQNQYSITSRRIIVCALLFLLIPFIYFVILFFDFDIGGVSNIHFDYITYANITEYLSFTGNESASLNYIYPELSNTTPYHYFELWLNCFLYESSSLYSINSLVFITYPTLLFGIVLGLAALLERCTNRLENFSLIFVVLFISGVSFENYADIHLLSEASNLEYSSLKYFKLLVPHLFVLLSVNFYVRKNYQSFLFSLLILPVVNISLIFCVFFALIFWAGIMLYRKAINKVELSKNLIISFVLLFSIYVFYGLSSSNDNGVGILTSILAFSDKEYLITSINIIVKSLFQLFVLYGPLLIILLLLFYQSFQFRKFRYYPELLCLIMLIIFSAFTWALFHSLFNSFQFFILPSSILLNVLISILVFKYFTSDIYTLKSFRLKIISLILMLGLFSFSIFDIALTQESRYDKIFLKDVRAEFHKNKINPIGGFIQSDLAKNNFSNSPPTYIIEGEFLEYITRGTFPISLSSIKIKISDDNKRNFELAARKNDPLCRFYDEQRRLNTYRTQKKVLQDFVKLNNIQFVVCDSGYDISNFYFPIRKIIRDPKSGVSIVFLKSK